MGFRGQGFLGFSLRLDQIRHALIYPKSCSFIRWFSIVEPQMNFTGQNSSPNQSTIDESYVLCEISKLLPISSKVSSRCTEVFNSSTKEGHTREFDSFLSPEEKLRGVFLQKLKGKTAIENALGNVGVELSLDVIARVADRGNLSGEAIVAFFRWAIKQPGVPEDIHSYNVILKALGRRKFFKFMVEILQEIGARGVSPNLETLTIVTDSFARAHQVRNALKVFENLEEMGMKRETESLNVLLQCLCQRSHVSAAYSIFNAKKGKIPFDNATYNIMISGWSSMGEVDATEKILKEMVADGLDPDCSTFSSLIEGLGRAGKIDDAVKIFDHITHNGFIRDTSVYNAMISNFISVGDLDRSLEYYRLMLDSDCDPDLVTYFKLISAFLKVRKVADALEMFEKMLSRGLVPTTGIITSFLKPLCSFGPPHAAMVIYQKSRKAGCKISPSAYKLLLMRLSRFGKCGMMLSVWDEMQENGHPCDLEVYEYVVNGLCNVGHLDNAVLVMEEAIRKGFCPGRLICSKLNNKLLSSNKTEMAYKLFLKIKKARLQDNARRYWRSNGWHF